MLNIQVQPPKASLLKIQPVGRAAWGVFLPGCAEDSHLVAFVYRGKLRAAYKSIEQANAYILRGQPSDMAASRLARDCLKHGWGPSSLGTEFVLADKAHWEHPEKGLPVWWCRQEEGKGGWSRLNFEELLAHEQPDLNPEKRERLARQLFIQSIRSGIAPTGRNARDLIESAESPEPRSDGRFSTRTALRRFQTAFKSW